MYSFSCDITIIDMEEGSMNDMIPISLIPIGIVVVIAVIAAILGALRGFSKSGLRFIGILGSAVASVATCLIIKEFFLEPDT